MANTNYTIQLKQDAGGVSAVVLRNSTTQPVDATSGAPNRLVLKSGFPDVGANSPLVQVSVTGATNATPIVITVSDATNLANGDWVVVEGVGGNTNANGNFYLAAKSGSTFELAGSAGNASYTSGGRLTKLNKAGSFPVALASVMAGILNDKSVIG